MTDRLLEQIKPFSPEFQLNERVDELRKEADGTFFLKTDMGTTFRAKIVVIAAGGGSFTPKRPPLAGIESFEKQVGFLFRAADRRVS